MARSMGRAAFSSATIRGCWRCCDKRPQPRTCGQQGYEFTARDPIVHLNRSRAAVDICQPRLEDDFQSKLDIARVVRLRRHGTERLRGNIPVRRSKERMIKNVVELGTELSRDRSVGDLYGE